MESFFRFFKGYLLIRITKPGFARFLNACVREGFGLWNIREERDYILFNISLSEFKKIQKCVKKSKVRVTIIKRYGLPFALISLRKNILFFVGIIICLFLLYYQKSHLWTLSVEGNKLVTTEELEDCMESYGFYAGILPSDFSLTGAEELIKSHFEEISWVSVSIEGTMLQICVIENGGASSHNETAIHEIPSSLYAASGGTIERIMVTKGYTTCRVGDEISEGDLLISGEIPITKNDGTVSYKWTYAQGDYLCSVKEPYYDEINCLKTIPAYTNKKSIYSLVSAENLVFGKLFYNGKKNEQIVFREYIDLNFLGLFDFDIYVVKSTQLTFISNENKMTKEECGKELQDRLSSRLQQLEDSGASEISHKVTLSSDGKTACLFGEIQYLDSSVIRKNIIKDPGGTTENGYGTTDNGTFH